MTNNRSVEVLDIKKPEKLVDRFIMELEADILSCDNPVYHLDTNKFLDDFLNWLTTHYGAVLDGTVKITRVVKNVGEF